MEWSREKTLEFIQSYKACSILWDSSQEQYKDRLKRHEALEELAIRFGTLTTEVERKIKNLQSHFLRERKRLLMMKKNTSTWFAYKPLSFLLNRNKIETRPRQRALSTQSTKKAEDRIPEPPPMLQTLQHIVPPLSAPNVIYAHKNATGYIEKPPEPTSEMFNWFKARDEYDLYGEQVAIKLRKIESPIARVTVQNRMNMLLMQAELGMLDAESHYAATASMEFCPVTKVEVVEDDVHTIE